VNFVYPSQFIQTLESTFFILANCSENKKRKMFWIKQVFHKDVTHKTYSYQTSSFKTSILLNTVLQNVKFFILIDLLNSVRNYITLLIIYCRKHISIQSTFTISSFLALMRIDHDDCIPFCSTATTFLHSCSPSGSPAHETK